MRMLLKMVFGLEATNNSIRGGKAMDVQQALLDRVKPEAAYFGAENGQRTGYIFFDLKDPADIPVIAEPLFQELGASLTFTPVMNLDDLQKGLAAAAGA
jgi:hypothetical protein